MQVCVSEKERRKGIEHRRYNEGRTTADGAHARFEKHVVLELVDFILVLVNYFENSVDHLGGNSVTIMTEKDTHTEIKQALDKKGGIH